jgi:inhibitor of KinA sporulation pathway (predicted exonuclease)
LLVGEKGGDKMADLKQFVFFDFEMLCSNRGMAFADMEAIRLGAVKYDLETEETLFFDRYIQPKQQKSLSEFCKKLTNIQDADLVDAQNFKSVFEEFLTWVGGVKRTRFFSWSPSDLSRLKLDAESHEVSPATIKKIEQRYTDFQEIFTKRVSKTNHSVENALALYDLKFEGDTHNPMYDAYNTLRIYLAFLNEPLKSDLIMLNKYIFENEKLEDLSQVNKLVKKQFKQDLSTYLAEMQIMFRLKDARKIIKRTNRIVTKYENILLNRSNLFDVEIQRKIRLMVEFYHELVKSFEEHQSHNSKIIILHEQMYQPIKQLAV